ncbi:hypothetical protein C0992_011262, partial [Termitomyces sp. T32_za158]
MSSTVDYTAPEAFDVQDNYNSKSYKTLLSARYNSLEHAEGCRIVEVTGWKQMKGVGQHEYTVVTIERDGKKANVIFERGPGKAIKPTRSLSSMDSSSSTFSSVSSLAVSRQSSASDKVTYSGSACPSFGAEKIWRIDFEDNPPFYMAVNFATTILKVYPNYTLNGTNCYFFTLVFKNMFIKHCKIRTKEEISKKHGKTQAGRTMGIRAWHAEKVFKPDETLQNAYRSERQEFLDS